MPPRKRTTPDPEPEQEPLETSAEDAQEEPTADKPKAPAAPEPAKSARKEAEQPCTECFREGWPDGTTSIGCAHGTWNRDL